MEEEIDHPWMNVESEPNGPDVEFLTDLLALLIILTVMFAAGFTYGVVV